MSQRGTPEWEIAHLEGPDFRSFGVHGRANQSRAPMHRWAAAPSGIGDVCARCALRRYVEDDGMRVYRLPVGRLVTGGEPTCKRGKR
jgi:hypothetical protein